MLRTALRPRWLALFALLVVVVAAFVRLGLWQFNAAQDEARVTALEEQASRPMQPLTQVLQPFEQFPEDGSGIPVTATGTYDAQGQVLVPDRLLEGRLGYWVVTPLVVQETGARLPVMRGFVEHPDEAAVPAVPAGSGEVTVEGALAPPEAPATTTDLPEGQIGSIDLGLLVNTWPGDIYHAFVFATGESPDVTVEDITPVPPPSMVPTGLDWRNAGYALQWWVFAAFAVYMWWRMVRDDHRQALEAQTGRPSAAGGPPGGHPSGGSPTGGSPPNGIPHEHADPERSETIHA